MNNTTKQILDELKRRKAVARKAALQEQETMYQDGFVEGKLAGLESFSSWINVYVEIPKAAPKKRTKQKP